MTKSIVPARLNESSDKLILLDQTLLPETEKYLELDTKEGIWKAIKSLSVRGSGDWDCSCLRSLCLLKKS